MAGGHSRYPQNLSLSQLLLKVYAKLHGESRETSFFRAALILTTIAWRHRFLETQRIRLRANRNFTWRNRSRITNHSRSNPSYRAIIDRELENIEMSSSRKYLVIRDCSVFESVFYPQNVIQFRKRKFRKRTKFPFLEILRPLLFGYFRRKRRNRSQKKRRNARRRYPTREQ